MVKSKIYILLSGLLTSLALSACSAKVDELKKCQNQGDLGYRLRTLSNENLLSFLKQQGLEQQSSWTTYIRQGNKVQKLVYNPNEISAFSGTEFRLSKYYGCHRECLSLEKFSDPNSNVIEFGSEKNLDPEFIEKLIEQIHVQEIEFFRRIFSRGPVTAGGMHVGNEILILFPEQESESYIWIGEPDMNSYLGKIPDEFTDFKEQNCPSYESTPTQDLRWITLAEY